MTLFVFLILVWPIFAPPTGEEKSHAPREMVYTDPAQVRRLPFSALEKKPRIRIEGTVTHANPLRRDFFIQDDYNGIYIRPMESDPGLKPGDRVVVEGHADPGEFAPMIVAKSVSRIGTAPLPEPIPTDLNESDSRWLDAQYVTVFCEILEVKVAREHLVLTIGMSRTQGTVFLPDTTHLKEIENLIGLPINICGVCVPKFKDRRIVPGPPRIHISSFEQIRTLHKRQHLTPAYTLPLSELKQFIALPFQDSRRVRVDGIVVGKDEGKLYVQDGQFGATVVTKEKDPQAPIGRRVKATGLLSIKGEICQLTSASILGFGTEDLPAPITPESESLTTGACNGIRIKVPGTVTSINTNEFNRPHVILDAGHSRIIVITNEAEIESAQFPVGAVVEVIGTAIKAGQWSKTDCALLMNQPGSVTILKQIEQPPFWNPARMLVVSVALGSLAFFSAIWVSILRKALGRQKVLLRTKAEREAELADKLRQSQKMEAIGRLAGGIAHDFNNMLTVINGSSEILATVINDDPELSRSLANDIRHAGTKAAGLVAQLLMFSRQRPAQLAPINLNDVVLDCEKMLRRVIGEDVKVFTIRDDSLPPILGEPILLHQVIVNLAVNARDAMPKGGTVTIASRRFRGPKDEPMVRLSVADSGCGMTPEVRDKLFEPFFTTKPIGQGTGLGLATVYGIVQTLKGTIHVESELNVGTTFDIDFPVAPDHTESTAELPTISRLIKLNASKRILLVEDDDAVRSLTTRILEMQGYEVATADGPDVALEMMVGQQFDMLITDVVMPGMGGRELADRARVMFPELRILFISGYTADEVLRRGVQEDDVDFLNKPFTTTQMSEKVYDILKRKPKIGGKSSLQLRPTAAIAKS